MWAKKLYNGSISITKNGFLGQYMRKMLSMKNQSSPEKQTNKQHCRHLTKKMMMMVIPRLFIGILHMLLSPGYFIPVAIILGSVFPSYLYI